MRKFRATVNNGAREKTFYIFHDAEGLYTWMCHPTHIDHELAIKITLYEGERCEYEWCGCEYAHESDTQFKVLHLVRFVAIKQSKNESGDVEVPIVGWVSSGILPIDEYADSMFTVTRIDDGEVDFNALFYTPDERDRFT